MDRHLKLALLIALSVLGYVYTTRCYARLPFELPCVAGATPMEAPTLNPTTQKLRAWLCVDSLGNVTSPVFGAAGGGVISFNTRVGAVLPDNGDYTVGQVTGAASLASPAFTGTPTAPTQITGDNTTAIATDAF